MKSSIISFLLLLAAANGALGSPVKRDDSTPPTVTNILQYALTLEHLENAFYTEALAKFDAAAFKKAGLPDWARGRFVQIGEHEKSHVSFLETALGKDAVAACNYSFPYTDPKSFAELSETLESVGVTAYLGGARFLTSAPDALTAAAAILTTEARHASWVEATIFKGDPWSGAFDTPLTQDLVFTLASSFITSCPASNPALPFKAFPALAVESTPKPGEKITLSFNSSSTDGLSLAILSGLSTTIVPISGKEATLPAGLQGLVFAVVTSNTTSLSDASTVAGPAVLDFPFGSSASNA